MKQLVEFVSQPWPWYVGGALIGLMVPALLLFGNRQFGLSASMRHICAAATPFRVKYFQYEWREHQWNLLVVAGIAIGAAIGAFALDNPNGIAISENTKNDLMQLGITDFSGYVPQEIFNWQSLLTVPGFIMIVVGGFLVGFGTRYANGCTSGHSITGLSILSWGSLVATVCFMAGGILVTHFILPLILK